VAATRDGGAIPLETIRRDGGGDARDALEFSATGQAYHFDWSTAGLPAGGCVRPHVRPARRHALARRLLPALTWGPMSLREDLQRRLLAATSRLPTSTLGRLGRTALAAARGGWAARDGGDPDAESLGAVVAQLGQLKGVAMKMGQIFSYIDLALPEDVRVALSVLQTHSPPMPFERVAELVRAELGDRAGELLDGMEPVPVAAASIGQVHRARLPGGRAVAVKVRYPDIERAIESDFGPAAIGSKMASLFYAGANVKPLLEEARGRFLEECDYANEARAQQRFGTIYEGHPTLVVPAVFPDLSTGRILTSAWLDGAAFETWLASGPSQEARDQAGVALFEFYVGTIFRHHLYNCDPHPGNYLMLGGGRLGMLDFGCTRAFEPPFVAALAAMGLAAHTDDGDELHRALIGMGMVTPERRYDFETARRLVRSFYGPMLRDEVLAVELGEAMGFQAMLGSKRELMKLTLPAELLFLFRIRFGLMSILARLGARANWYRLERGFAAAGSTLTDRATSP
jgi:predicted unusual protein kinase regulating ubiquinone biosynthesis (AarF/ABC1/UbiB family)